ncbi:MAG TPA: hypothetical protein VGH66_05310 [Acidimicrobiales bacterium]
MRPWAPLAALLLVGCAAGSQSTISTTASGAVTSAVGATTATGAARRAQAGKVTAVHDQHVTIAGAPAGDGDSVATGATVASDSTGSFDFSVGSTIHKCLTDHDSSLQLLPTPSVLIAWQKGASWCQKSGGDQAEFGIGPGLVAVMKDPVFAVRVDPSGTVLKVEQGFVRVQSAKGASVLVGPGQQTSASPGGAPGPAVPLVADEKDNTNFPALNGLSPAPAFGRPSAAGSAALARIFRTGAMRVSFVAPARGANSQTVQFSSDFFSFLTQHWDLKLQFSTASGSATTTSSSTRLPGTATTAGPGTVSTAAGGSNAGTSSTAAVPDVRVEVQTATNVGTPLLSDGTTIWRMVGVDAGLQTGLRNFLVAALGSGDYANLYSQDFGRPPSYDAVAGLVAPS